MGRRKSKNFKSPLEWMADLAEVLDSEAFVDGLSTTQKHAFREASDVFKQSFESFTGLEIGPTTLVSMVYGASAQVAISAQSNPVVKLLSTALGQAAGADKNPDTSLMIVLGYLARDFLAGERVE